MSQAPSFGVALIVSLGVLLALGLGVSQIGRLGVGRSLVTATLRACAQLAAVSVVIAAVLSRTWMAVLFAFVMFAVATFTAAGRVGARRDWTWIAVALAAGVLPVLAIIFGLQVTTFTGAAIIPIAGIIIGGAMTAHTLTARRAFDVLRSDKGQVDAGLALGLARPAAIALIISRHTPEALHPAIDQTRTVGLVTLPGAFVGVLLGGGSAADAAAAQVLVLVGLLAAETCVVETSRRLIASGRIMPRDLRLLLPRR
jgi:UDP-glucose/iron transport system permease protein